MTKVEMEEKKERKIRLIEVFYKEYGRLPKVVETAQDGTKIGFFLNGIKNENTKITEEQKSRLERIGVFENPIEEEKERKIRLIEEFFEEYKRLPKRTEKAQDGTKIGFFLNSIKNENTKITEEQKSRLERIGVFEISTEKEKERKIRLIEEFYKEYGRLPMLDEIAQDGTKIGIFLRSIKRGNTKITKKQQERLKKLNPSSVATTSERQQLIEWLKKARESLNMDSSISELPKEKVLK